MRGQVPASIGICPKTGLSLQRLCQPKTGDQAFELIGYSAVS
jgi:hypothetical protein